LIGGAGFAMVASAVLTWLVRAMARHRGWLTGPISHRHIHTAPRPRLGGIAVGGAFAMAVLLLRHLGAKLDFALVCAVLVPAIWMFVVGLTDDLANLRARHKLLAQMIGGTLMFAFGVRFPVSGIFGDQGPWTAALSLVLTVGWSVAVMNAVNLIDGLDGLASGVSMCVLAALLVMAMLAPEPSVALLSVLALGAVTGFLLFNLHPASIFLGDCGSLVLGSLIAAFSIRLISISSTGWLACTVLLTHPFAEVLISITRRFLRGDPIFCPDRRHLHHRLLDRGLSHPHAAGVLILASLLSSIVGVLVFFGGLIALTALALGTAGFVLGVVELHYGEFKHFWSWVQSWPKQRQVIGTQMHLDQLQQALPAVRSLTELRILLSESFVACGCEEARLRVRSYDGAAPGASVGTDCASLVFALRDRTAKLGTLELTWNVKKGHWPFDLRYFSTEIVPVLSRKLGQFVHLHGDVVRTVRTTGGYAPDFLPRIAAEAQVGDLRVPLNS
jgi:UDP-N-acetylmuramyl pentapeptide phosphotransferase/UDP-N-acetylglucosamine-1-phosphate transferase